MASHLGDAIRQMRCEQEMSQGHLADLVGVHRNTISRLESYADGAKVGVIESIAAALSVTASRIFARSEEIASRTVQNTRRKGAP